MNEVNDALSYTRSDNPQVQAERTLLGLGFKFEELSRPTETFSQGWNMRIELAKILLSKPDVLLLDEPTNHLDIESIEWLEGYLKDLKDYYCFAEDEGKGIRRVSVAKKNNKDEEIFSFRMVAEPDSFGKWKIFSIEREGKE